MPLHYLDTSALVKRYVTETGTDWIDTLLSTELIAVSTLTTAEMASALARRTREGDLTVGGRDITFRRFLADMRQYTVVETTRSAIRDAASMLLQVPGLPRLRTLDALHLACARSTFTRARRLGLGTGRFVTADRALAQAAASLGLPVANPEDYP